MDPNTAWMLIALGFIMLMVGLGGRIALQLPGIKFAGFAGVLVVLIGIAGLIGWL